MIWDPRRSVSKWLPLVAFLTPVSTRRDAKTRHFRQYWQQVQFQKIVESMLHKYNLKIRKNSDFPFLYFNCNCSGCFSLKYHLKYSIKKIYFKISELNFESWSVSHRKISNFVDEKKFLKKDLKFWKLKFLKLFFRICVLSWNIIQILL